MQSTDDKCQAIISLLGLVWLHLDSMPGAMKTPNQQWVSERSPLDDPPKPPALYNVDCNGRCWTCIAFQRERHGRVVVQCPSEEHWARLREQLRREYRIADVEDALMFLAAEDATRAQAVFAVYVEPWPCPRTEPIAPETKRERARLAEIGVMDMAEIIDGYVRPYGATAPTKQEQAESLIADGIKSPSIIAQRLGCSVRHAKRLKAAAMVRC